MSKIAIIIPHADKDEAVGKTLSREVRELSFADKLRSLGYSVEVFGIHYANTQIVYIAEHITSYPADVNNFNISYLTTSRSLESAVKQFAPDIVIIKGLGYAISKNIFLTLKPHRLILIVGGGLKDDLVPFADALLIEFREQLDRITPSPSEECIVRVLPKYIADDEFSDPDAERRYDADVLCVGDFKPRKNQKALLPLMDTVQIAFVGDGEFMAEVQNLAKDKKFPPIFHGRLGRKATLETMRRAKLLAHPSLQEGLPRVIAEAFAQGLPVVGLTTVLSDAIANGETGLLCDQVDLVMTIGKLLENTDERTRLARNAYRYATSNFSAQASFEIVRSILQDIETKRMRCSILSSKIYVFLSLISSQLRYFKRIVRRNVWPTGKGKKPCLELPSSN